MLPIHTFQNTNRTRAIVRGIGAAAVVALLTGCMLFSRPPEGLDYSRTRVSESGLYRASIRPQGDSIPQGRMHSWTLHLESVNGGPVDLAQVVVDGGMPQHGHGLPTKPRVTQSLGNGDHVIEGMKFNMGGWWILKVRVSSDAGSDSLVFNLHV